MLCSSRKLKTVYQDSSGAEDSLLRTHEATSNDDTGNSHLIHAIDSNHDNSMSLDPINLLAATGTLRIHQGHAKHNY